MAMLSGSIGILYLCHLAFSFGSPDNVWKFLTPLIILGLLNIFIILFNIPSPSINEKGIILWNIKFLPGLINIISGAITTGSAIIFFHLLWYKNR